MLTAKLNTKYTSISNSEMELSTKKELIILTMTHLITIVYIWVKTRIIALGLVNTEDGISR